MDEKRIIENTLKMLSSTSSSERVFLESFSLFRVKRENVRKCFVIFMGCLAPAYLIGTSWMTVSLMREAMDLVISILLTLFGVFFTGYVLFQAMINPKLLSKLLEDTKDSKSSLELSNDAFIKLMMIYLAAIFVTIFLKIITLSVSEKWSLFESLQLSNGIAVIGCEVYFYFVATVIWEAKTFIYNISLIFKVYAATRIQEIIEKNEKTADKN